MQSYLKLLASRVTIQSDESKCRLVLDTPFKLRCSGNILLLAGERL